MLLFYAEPDYVILDDARMLDAGELGMFESGTERSTAAVIGMDDVD